MIITEYELRTLFKSWCSLNNRKESDGEALNVFCQFAKSHYEVREVK